jgi:hypothetical protein
MLLRVSASTRVRIAVELERSGTTIRGRLAVENTAEVEFFGWLELIDGLQRAVQQLEHGVVLAAEDAEGPW